MPSPITQVRLSEELTEKLKALAEETEYSVSAIVRACIERALPYVESKVRQ